MNHNGQSQRASLDNLRKRIEHYSYCTLDKLGSGYSSEVFRGRDDRNGKNVAIKVVNLKKVREKGQVDLLMREIQFLQQIKHQNLVTCLDVLMTNNNCYIVTQYCADGDLNTLLVRRGRLGVDEALRLIIEMVAALCHLHHKGIIHRDIKPQNILIHKNKPKIADLGFAIQCETLVRDGYKIGTPLYMSPQALQQKEYSRKSDVWSLGVTMYQIFEGRAPWEVRGEGELRQALKNEIQFKYLKHQELIQVIRGCLAYNREARLAAQQILIRLQKIMGIENTLGQGNRSNKENIQSQNCNQRIFQSQEIKKSIANNYSLLKWMINYSRFAAKMLSKLNKIDLGFIFKEPFIEFTARCLHMSISKLKRIDQYHSQLALEHYDYFKHTHKCIKIKAVTEQYHQKYLMILAKLPYRYYLSDSIVVEFPAAFITALKNIPIYKECSRQHLTIVQSMITLSETNLLAGSQGPSLLCHSINFEKIIQKIEYEPDCKTVQLLSSRREIILEKLKREQSKGEVC